MESAILIGFAVFAAFLVLTALAALGTRPRPTGRKASRRPLA